MVCRYLISSPPTPRTTPFWETHRPSHMLHHCHWCHMWRDVTSLHREWPGAICHDDAGLGSFVTRIMIWECESTYDQDLALSALVIESLFNNDCYWLGRVFWSQISLIIVRVWSWFHSNFKFYHLLDKFNVIQILLTTVHQVWIQVD